MSENRKRIALGVDIGGTRIKTVAFEEPGRVLGEHRIDSDADKGPEAVRAAIRRAVEYYEGIKFDVMGIGCAGSVDPETGVVLNSPNFSDWSNVPLKTWGEEDFKIPVRVGNDATLAMFTEFKLGGARNMKNAVLLTFGTGVGGGLILNGQLYMGATGSGAELGHFSIHADGIQCACGNRGCFERYCSASALEVALPEYTVKEIFARGDEEPFRAVIAQFLHELKVGLVSLCNIFDPEVVLIGGGLSKGMERYLPELRTWVREHAFPAVAKKVRLEPTQYANQSGAIGAALLALE